MSRQVLNVKIVVDTPFDRDVTEQEASSLISAADFGFLKVLSTETTTLARDGQSAYYMPEREPVKG